VEIDLLRQGKHVVAVSPASIRGRRAPYIACVLRATAPTKAEVYPMPLQQRLPVIKVPLRPKDADVLLDLQAMIELVYRRGRYESDLDYSKDPVPTLTGPDADWAEQLLVARGLRKPAARKPRRRKTPPA